MKKHLKKPSFVDDGRVVASMNVDGMPWYSPKAKREQAGGDVSAPIAMDRREKAAFTFGVLKAALLVTFVFIGTLLAFILFCTEIWFR